MSIGKNIQRIRKSKGIKAKDLADTIEVSKSMVSQWENDVKPPVKFETLEKIAAALDVSVLEIIYGPDIAKKRSEALDILGIAPIDLELLRDFHILTNSGKEEAIKLVRNLIYVPEYSGLFTRRFEEESEAIKTKMTELEEEAEAVKTKMTELEEEYNKVIQDSEQDSE